MMEVLSSFVVKGWGGIQSWIISILWGKIIHDDRGVKVLRWAKLIPATPKSEFSLIYAYTLAEYGDGKHPSVLALFRDVIMKAAFKRGFDSADFSKVDEEAQYFLESWEFASQLHQIRFDYQQEVKEFARVFDRITIQTRTPVEVKQDQSIAEVIKGIDQQSTKLERIYDAVNDQKRLVLDLAWFKGKFEKQISGIKDKYNPELHTETEVDRFVHAIICDKTQIRYLNQLITELIGAQEQFAKSAQALSSQEPRLIKWGNTKEIIIKLAYDLDSLSRQIIGDFQKALFEIKCSQFENVQKMHWENALDGISGVLNTYLSQVSQINLSMLPCKGDEDVKRWNYREAEKQIRNPARIMEDFVFKAERFINQLTFLNQFDMNILGKAGIGKTHLASHICFERISHGLPVLFLLGRQFTSDASFEEQMRQILDVPPVYSWQDFLQALSVAASKYQTRIPIIIDGLNEATFHGVFSNIWRLGLPGIEQELAATHNIVLITTCRSTYQDVIWSDTSNKSFIEARGFNENSLAEAMQKYFTWYKIRADYTPISLAQFENPIYLQIFCKSKNFERKDEVHVYIGQDLIFDVYDNYLHRVNRVICEQLNLQQNTPIILPVLTSLSEYLWTNQSRGIPLDEAIKIIDGIPRYQLNWTTSKTRAIEEEGLLVNRDWENNQEILYITYDLLAGYIIAGHIIEKAGKYPDKYFNSAEMFQKLFCNDYKQLHPLSEDILQCLAALSPIRINQYLHELVDNPKAFNASVKALFEIRPGAINENAIGLVKKLFKKQENRSALLNFLPFTLGNVGHPFCASFWSQLLMPLTIVERDVTWTEYVRQNEESFEKIINYLENNCKKQIEQTDLFAAHLNLYAEGVMWVLTSTVRPLRDKATRALYWFGRCFPDQLLRLTHLSFKINDPYVSERLLAAVYGVAMARQYDFADKSFAEKILPSYGRELFDAMFCVKAPFATTHILARDYALRAIQIALLHHKDLLSEAERKRIIPPFQDGGIREWGQSNIDEELTEPIRMDFRNYTVGQLVRNRNNYDFKHNDYKIVLSNLYWRILNLGYREEIFIEIEKEINQRNSWRSQLEDKDGKVDRYGKKYSWIAFFELAGYRRDNGLFGNATDEPRLSNADLDPSFPDEIPTLELVKGDFLGDRKTSRQEWILNGGMPDFSPYLVVDNLCGEFGDWVLLDGFFNQEDLDSQRKQFLFPRGLIVKHDSLEEIIPQLEKQDFEIRQLPKAPADYYTFAGEIPWANTYPHNGTEIFEVGLSESNVDEVQQGWSLSRNGILLSKEEGSVFWKQVALQEEAYRKGQLDCVIDEVASQMGIDIYVEVRPKTIELEMHIPIRKNCWEGYHSTTNPGRDVFTLSREIAEHFHLRSQPQTYDLFDETGRRASISIQFGEQWHTVQSLIYIRKDLLDKYLSATGFNLLWVLEGERTVMGSEIGVQAEGVTYKNFQQIRQYFAKI